MAPGFDGIVSEIRAERAAQDLKWGEQNHSPVRYFAILAEEHGEVAKEVVEATFARSETKRALHLGQLRAELVQTAAVTIAMIEALDRAADQGVDPCREGRP